METKLKFIEEEFRRLKENFPDEFSKVEDILSDTEISKDLQLLIIELEIPNQEFCLKFLKIFYQNMYYIHSDPKYSQLVNEKYIQFTKLFN